MKIGILTQPLHGNYGGLLQNYALQQVLLKEGYDVKTIDWYYDFRSSRERRVSFLKTRFLSLLNPFFKNKHFLTKKETRELSSKVLQFKNNLYLTKRVNTLTSLKRIAEEECFDAFIVGSDQCWRPKYNGPFLPVMFLSFVRNRTDFKRIAYAASFGTDNWEYSDSETRECSDLIKLFDFVSVRELSGKKLCHDYLGVEASLVFDPTLLLNIEEYRKLIKEDREKNESLLVTYILDKTSSLEKSISIVEKRTGLSRRELTPASYTYKGGNDIEKYKKMSVNDWLGYIYHAEMTIVDSFHGTLFSILFNKPFWVLGNEERGMSRFDSILKMFHLEDRLIDKKDLISIDLYAPIDWNMVNEILNDMRVESTELLLNHLK